MAVQVLLSTATWLQARGVRLFPIAVGPTPDLHRLRALAARAGGVAEWLDPTRKGGWAAAVQRQLSRSGQSAWTHVHVAWEQHADERGRITQENDDIIALGAPSHCLHTCMCACVCLCACRCTHVSMDVCVCMHVCARTHAWM
jgi:hypothetical protein